jgi:hypothetical protein
VPDADSAPSALERAEQALGPDDTPASRSLLRGRNLERALRVVRTRMGGPYLVRSLDVADSYLTIIVERGTRARIFTFDAAFGVVDLAPGPDEHREPVPVARIDGDGPRRAVRTALERGVVSADATLDSALLVPDRGAAEWEIAVRGARGTTTLLRSSADGRRVGLLGG